MKRWKRITKHGGKYTIRENGKWIDHESAQVALEIEAPRTENPFLGLFVALPLIFCLIAGVRFDLCFSLAVIASVGLFAYKQAKGWLSCI